MGGAFGGAGAGGVSQRHQPIAIEPLKRAALFQVLCQPL